MKRTFRLLAALCLLPLSGLIAALPDAANARADKVVYAYMPADTVLYRADAEAYAPVVVLPATYFVAVLDAPDEEWLHVSYLDLTGFVSASSVEKCDYTPVTVCASLSARAQNDGQPVNLRDAPDNRSGAVLLTLPADASMTLYGSVSGSELIHGAGNVWHYVRYEEGNAVTYGYVYSGHVDADAAQPNVIEKVPDQPIDKPDENADIVNAPPRFDTKLQIIFIVALSVPAVVIMLLLFRRRPEKKANVPRGSDDAR